MEDDLTQNEEPVEAPVEDLPAGTPSPETDPVTTAVRLVVGTASLGLETFTSRLRAWAQDPSPAQAEITTPEAAPRNAMVSDAMVGLAARGARTALSLGARGTGLALRGLQAAEGATAAVTRAMPGFVTEPVARIRERAGESMSRLGSVGRDELDRSRAIARAALEDGLEALLARVADSRELQVVIRTQSVSAAEDAVDQLRGRAATIDDRLEGAARRFLRRTPRPRTSPSR